MRNVDLRRIFENETQQHVIVWNRFDQEINYRALLLVKELLSDCDFSEHVLPLLYPLGRYDSDYQTLDRESQEQHKHSYHRVDHRGPPGETRTTHAELCLQISDQFEEQSWKKLVAWIDDNKHGWA